MIDSSNQKRKKLPACDYCKAKRVLCHPKLSGPCPRCLEKGIDCRTSPVVRRKRRTRAQLQNEHPRSHSLVSSSRAASSDIHIEDLSIWRASPVQIISPSFNIPSLDLPSSFVKELFQEFRSLTWFYHPLLPIDSLESSLNRCSWHLPSLTPQFRVLAQCIIAVTARTSGSAHIIGPANGIPDIFAQAPFKTRLLDCREFGHRREAICEQLRAEAVWLVQHEGVMSIPSVFNAASLELVEFLEYRASGKGGNAYSTAYIHHLRDMSDAVSPLDLTTQTRYSAFFMRSALCSISTGSSITFTHHDELLMCGEDPCSLEEVLDILSPNSPVLTPIYTIMRPVTFHLIRLSRQLSENLTGPYARRHPLNEAKLICQLNELDLLHNCVTASLRQMENLRNTTHFCLIRLCVFPLVHGWGALCLVLFEELKRRRELVRVSLGEEGTDRGMLRMQARLQLLYKQARAMTSQAALEIAGSLKEIPSLSTIAYTSYARLPSSII